MKYILFCLLVLLPACPAFAMDCTSSKAIAQAKTAFADGLTNSDSIQLENVAEGTLGAMPVCQGILGMNGQSEVVTWANNDDGTITSFQQDSDGNVTTQTLGPNGAQQQLQAIQNQAQQMANQFDQGQAAQQKQADQAAYDQTSQLWAEDKPKCDQIEQHPISSGLLNILVGNGVNDALKGTSTGLTLAKCQKLQTLMTQLDQQASQEGLTMNDQGNQGGNP